MTVIDRQLNKKLGESPSILDFGAVGDGVTDCTSAIQSAFDDMDTVPPGGRLFIPPGDYLVSDGLLRTTPIHLYGCGWNSRILAKSTIGSSTDILTLASDATDQFGWAAKNFAIVPQSGTPGRHALAIDITAYPFYDANFKHLRLVSAGAGKAFATLPAANWLTDGFFLATFDGQCVFDGGVYLDKAGDSIRFHQCAMRGPNDGVYAYLVPGVSGGAHALVIDGCNITSYASAIRLLNASYARILNNNIEHPHSDTSANAAQVDLDGITLSGTVNTSNSGGVFTATRASGDKFFNDAALLGDYMTINGVDYIVIAWGTPDAQGRSTTATLYTDPGNQTGVSYSFGYKLRGVTLRDNNIAAIAGMNTVRVHQAIGTNLDGNQVEPASSTDYAYWTTSSAKRTKIRVGDHVPGGLLPHNILLDQSTPGETKMEWDDYQQRRHIGVSSQAGNTLVLQPGYNQGSKKLVELWDNWSGFVDTSGTTVTINSAPTDFREGDLWVGGIIYINGTLYFIDSVTDATHLELTSSAGTQTNVAAYFNGAVNGFITKDGRLFIGYAADDPTVYLKVAGLAYFESTINLREDLIFLASDDHGIRQSDSGNTQHYVLKASVADDSVTLGFDGAVPLSGAVIVTLEGTTGLQVQRGSAGELAFKVYDESAAGVRRVKKVTISGEEVLALV